MILKATQRSNAEQLARHLLNLRDNDHVKVLELRGFVSETLDGALKEAHAVANGSRCRQFLFSVSLNPPEAELPPDDVFLNAIGRIEDQVGLAGQPRAIVFHEKEGRRHCHCVWSRVEPETLKAVPLPHFKLKLQSLSRDLYLEQEWDMPRGFLNAAERNPLNFTIEEWQQAKRVKQDPRVIKQIFRDCWHRSDSEKSFASALRDNGFFLARGDRRGHVVVDWNGEVYSVSRWAGIKTNEVKMRCGDGSSLPDVAAAKAEIGNLYSGKLRSCIEAEEARHGTAYARLQKRRSELVAQQRAEREKLRQQQRTRSDTESAQRANRLPRGLKALWFRLTGQYAPIKLRNERDSQSSLVRDRGEKHAMISIHWKKRREMQAEIEQFLLHRKISQKTLQTELRRYQSMAVVAHTDDDERKNRLTQKIRRDRRMGQ
jgi:hypothetical protein